MIVRRIARPLLSTVFIAGGIDSLRNPAAKVPAASAVEQAATKLPASVRDKIPTDPETLVKINAAVQVGAGALLAVGKAPRLASLTLAASLAPTTVVSHSFWNVEDPAERSAQRIQFFKNLSLLGALLIAAVDTEGKPSLGWRGRRAVRHAQDRVTEVFANDSGHPALAAVSDRAQEAAEHAGVLGSEALGVARERGSEALEVARERGGEWADLAREHGTELAELARTRGGELAELVRERGGELAELARGRGGELAEIARERGGELAEIARERGGEWAATAGGQAEVFGRRARRQAQRAIESARERAVELHH
ncbi:DoxX family membrane protein [Rhodococcus sp. NPDC003318]|uniref:DoxX family membrane protein n=1 Tax=Rhodococcus sp. NPDC003318 TaxID=3364503 RepID=UPI0036955BB9